MSRPNSDTRVSQEGVTTRSRKRLLLAAAAASNTTNTNATNTNTTNILLETILTEMKNKHQEDAWTLDEDVEKYVLREILPKYDSSEIHALDRHLQIWTEWNGPMIQAKCRKLRKDESNLAMHEEADVAHFQSVYGNDQGTQMYIRFQKRRLAEIRKMLYCHAYFQLLLANILARARN